MVIYVQKYTPIGLYYLQELRKVTSTSMFLALDLNGDAGAGHLQATLLYPTAKTSRFMTFVHSRHK